MTAVLAFSGLSLAGAAVLAMVALLDRRFDREPSERVSAGWIRSHARQEVHNQPTGGPR